MNDSAENKPTYKLSANENAWGPSPNAIAALQVAATNVNRYPPRTDAAFRAALETHHAREGLTADHFYTADGGVEVLLLLMLAYLETGDEFIVCPPTFQNAYRRFGNIANGIMVEVPLTADFQLDIPAILAAITPRTRFVIVCNPNNPTATTMPSNDVMTLLDALPEDVLLVADEVYHHFITDEQFPDTVQAVLDGRNVVVVHSFSKGFGLAGLRIGYGIAPPEIVQRIAKKRRPFHINALNTAAAIAALDDKPYLAQTTAATIAERDWVLAELDRLGVQHWGSQTNFVLVKTVMLAKDLAIALEKHGVLVNPQSGLLQHCIRVTFGTREANQAFIAALEAILG